MLNHTNFIARNDMPPEKAVAYLTEDSLKSSHLCPNCTAEPLMVTRILGHDEFCGLEYFVACGCKVGISARNRKTAQQNWDRQLFNTTS